MSNRQRANESELNVLRASVVGCQAMLNFWLTRRLEHDKWVSKMKGPIGWFKRSLFSVDMRQAILDFQIEIAKGALQRAQFELAITEKLNELEDKVAE